MGRRTLLLIASILVAAVGTALIGFYVQGADSRARGRTEVTSVLVSTVPIEAGAAAVPDSFDRAERRVGDLPPRAITSSAQIKGRAVSRILAGQILTTDMFGVAGAAAGVRLAADERAVSIDLGDPERTASLLAPGSEVNIYVTTKDGNESTTSPVFPFKVTVLAIGDEAAGAGAVQPTAGSRSATEGRGDELPTSNVTLKLKTEQAPELIQAQANGELYFTWAGPGATTTAAAG